MVLLIPALANAQPIAGTTYTYDLSTEDIDPGGFPTFATPHTSADDTVDQSDLSVITSGGVLNDGDLGDDVTKVPFGNQSVLFANGTYAGFQNLIGVGQAPQPRINIDLGGMFDLTSFTLYYLVEDPTSIYSPRPVPDDGSPPPFTFNALTVLGSSDGTNFSEFSFTNAFNPLTGIGGDIGSGTEEIRTAVLDLTGNSASTLRIDVHTPWAFIFMSEYVVEGTAVTGIPGDFDMDGDVDGDDFLLWQRDMSVGDLADWEANYGAGGGAGQGVTAIPEPSTLLLVATGACGLICRRRTKSRLCREPSA